MTARKKLLLFGLPAAVLVVGFWFYWSPDAKDYTCLSLVDSFKVRWLVRTQTFQHIRIIQGHPAGNIVIVETGEDNTPTGGSGGSYWLHTPPDGWKIFWHEEW